MCGICGYLHLDFDERADARVVEAMNQRIAHRGPDDEGVYTGGPIGLGQRRLSIIDLAAGHQPLSNEDGTVWVTYNGEIYNFQELSKELIAKGHHFATRTDTEVLVHLYEEHGVNFVQHLNGMFGLGIWDARRNRLVLARDRMGQKPLYWGVFDRQLIFASELKAILAHPAVERKVNMDALAHYLSLSSVPAPYSIFEGIHKLPPGHRLVVENGVPRSEQYWEYSLGARSVNLTREEAREQFTHRLRESVRQRLISDVPLGVFLSGGLDSSTIAALMCQVSDGPVQSFSIGFEDKDFDESSHARRVSKHLGTIHHEKTLSSRAALELIPRLGKIIDEPLADPSVVPTYLLSEFASEHVKVVLGGDGGDELLAGYPNYMAHHYLSGWEGFTSALARRVMQPCLRNLPGRFDSSKTVRRLRKLGGLWQHRGTLARYYQSANGLFPTEHPQLFTDDAWEAVSPEGAWKQGRAYLDACPSQDRLEQILFLDAKLFMQDDILVKVDLTSMAFGLEVRAPLLDVNVVEFIATLPNKHKIKGRLGKYLLRQTARDLLPREIIDRPKQGFMIPVARWLRGEFRELLEDLFTEDRLRQAGLFRPEYVRRLMSEHFNEQHDHHRLLWQLLMFELWSQEHTRSPVAAVC